MDIGIEHIDAIGGEVDVDGQGRCGARNSAAGFLERCCHAQGSVAPGECPADRQLDLSGGVVLRREIVVL